MCAIIANTDAVAAATACGTKKIHGLLLPKKLLLLDMWGELAYAGSGFMPVVDTSSGLRPPSRSPRWQITLKHYLFPQGEGFIKESPLFERESTAIGDCLRQRAVLWQTGSPLKGPPYLLVPINLYFVVWVENI